MTAPSSQPEPDTSASIQIKRRIDWVDTDAAGISHWTTIFRLAEQAEAALFTALGIDWLFGATPRLAVQMRYRSPLRFNEVVSVDLRIAHVGSSSIRFAIQVSRETEVAAEGELTICLLDTASGRPTEVPRQVRTVLLESGAQLPVD